MEPYGMLRRRPSKTRSRGCCGWARWRSRGVLHPLAPLCTLHQPTQPFVQPTQPRSPARRAPPNRAPPTHPPTRLRRSRLIFEAKPADFANAQMLKCSNAQASPHASPRPPYFEWVVGGWGWCEGPACLRVGAARQPAHLGNSVQAAGVGLAAKGQQRAWRQQQAADGHLAARHACGRGRARGRSVRARATHRRPISPPSPPPLKAGPPLHLLLRACARSATPRAPPERES